MVKRCANTDLAICAFCRATLKPGEGRVEHGDRAGTVGSRTVHRSKRVCKGPALLLAGARKGILHTKAFWPCESQRVISERLAADVIKHGLVSVPVDRCQFPRVRGLTLWRRAAFPEMGSSFGGWYGELVIRVDATLVAYLGYANRQDVWASPSLVEAGLRQYRLCQRWVPGYDRPQDYPGPAVADDTLTDEERGAVVRLREQAAQAKRAEAMCGIRLCVPTVLKDYLTRGATWTVEPIDVAELDEYERDRGHRAGRTLRVLVKVTRPGAVMNGGKRRLLWKAEERIHAHCMAVVEVTET